MTNQSAYRQSDDDARWRSALARDGAAAHAFYICVRTTGVYCISTCAARPLRKNVFFAATRAEAEAAGMRPCKRCKPDAGIGRARNRFAPGRVSIKASASV